MNANALITTMKGLGLRIKISQNADKSKSYILGVHNDTRVKKKQLDLKLGQTIVIME